MEANKTDPNNDGADAVDERVHVITETETEPEVIEVYMFNMETQEAFTISCPANGTMLDVKKEIEILLSHDVERQTLVYSKGEEMMSLVPKFFCSRWVVFLCERDIVRDSD